MFPAIIISYKIVYCFIAEFQLDNLYQQTETLKQPFAYFHWAWAKYQELLLLLLSRFSRVRLPAAHRRQPTRLPVPGILQTRTLEWVAISFSKAWKWKVKVKSLSRVWLFETPGTAAHQAPPSMGLSRQEYWSGVPLSRNTQKYFKTSLGTEQLCHSSYPAF